MTKSSLSTSRPRPGDIVPAIDSADALRALADLAAEGLCLVAPADGTLLYANAALAAWFGPPAGQVVGSPLADWLPAAGPHLADFARQPTELAFAGRLNGAAPRPALEVEVVLRPVSAAGCTLAAVAIRPALPAGRRQIDPLTGLADRTFLIERLRSLLGGERSRDPQCAVLFVDVNRFKQVNDAHGHLIGDRVLCAVADKLAGSVRSEDRVARFGGDEFVVLLERVSGPAEIHPVVARINAAFRQPIELPQGQVTLSVSIGVAEAQRHATEAEALLDAADRAMYAAKRAAS